MGSEPVDTKQAAYRAGRVLRVLGRPLRVTEPCVGLGGFRRLCEMSASAHCFTQAFDSEESLKPYYARLAKDAGNSAVGSGLHLGKAGDVQAIPLEALQPTEAFTAGPPCQPWAPTGHKQGTADERSGVMDCCVTWIIHLGWLGQLLAFTLENSSRLRGTAYLDEILQRLQVCLPFFVVQVHVRNLSQIFPHNRERLWIRGLRRDCVQGMPGLPPPLGIRDLGGRVHFQTLLDSSVPPHDPQGLSTNMQCNLAAYIAAVQQDIQQGRAGEVAICELDRSPLKDFCSHVVYDCSPALRTSGPKLWVMLCSDIKKKLPWQEHRLHRFLSTEERFLLQGHCPRTACYFHCRTKASKAAGNAYHPLELGAMLCPLLELAFVQGKLQLHPKTLTEDELWQMMPPALSILTAERCAESGEDPFDDEVQQDLKTCALLGVKLATAPQAAVKLQPVKKELEDMDRSKWPAGLLNQDPQKRVFVNLATPQRRVRRKCLDLETADSPGPAGT